MRYGGKGGQPESLFKRVMSALLGLPLYGLLIYSTVLQSTTVLIISSIVSLACLYEFYMISEKEDYAKAFVVPGIIAGLLINVLMYLYAYGDVYLYNRYIPLYSVKPFFSIILLLIAIILVFQIFKRNVQGGIYSLSITIFGLIMIVLSFSHLILMKALPNGIYYILIVHVAVMSNDTFAYFGGSIFGKHKAGITVSPNKSWEGFFSGLLFCVISVLICNEALTFFLNIHLFSTIESAIIGILIAIFADIGDLAESAIKRDGGFKDSGTLVPGHGGMWDVFDALIFTIPVFYYYLQIRGV